MQLSLVAGSLPPLPSTTSGPRRLRPWYLVAMMVLTWFVGVHGLATGCTAMGFLKYGNLPDMGEVTRQAKEGDDPVQYMVMVSEAAQLRAMAEARQVTFPLSAAKVLLGGLLLVASGLAMAGRPGARALALQALAANAVLAAIEYGLTRSVRGVWIEDVVRAGALIPRLPPEQAFILSRTFWWWIERVRFALVDVGIFTLAAVALTRPRTKTFFDAVAAAADRPTDEP